MRTSMLVGWVLGLHVGMILANGAIADKNENIGNAEQPKVAKTTEMMPMPSIAPQAY